MRQDQLAIVTLHLAGASGHPIELRRTPKYLRFVVTGTDWKTLDALDQLDDKPKDGERVIAAVKSSEGRVHVDGVRKGRRFGEYYKTATYRYVSPQPDQLLLGTTDLWRAWCYEQDRISKMERKKC